jgi:hypothetical protein
MPRWIPLILLTAAALVNACGRPTTPAPDIADERFADLLAEVLVLQDRYAEQADSLTVHRAALLDSAGITEQQVREYIQGLQSRPEAWVPLLEEVEARLDSLTNAEPDSAQGDHAQSSPPVGSTEAIRYKAR